MYTYGKLCTYTYNIYIYTEHVHVRMQHAHVSTVLSQNIYVVHKNHIIFIVDTSMVNMQLHN